jgi:hypothetical protein
MLGICRRVVLVAVAGLLMRPTSAAPELYERLGLAPSATEREIKKAWHWHALKSHPDKVQGGPDSKERAEATFKRIAEAYEVLSDGALRAAYDRTGQIPGPKAKADAAASSRKGGAAGDDDDYGYEASQHGRERGPHWDRWAGWGMRFNQFEVNLAQGRARRVRTLAGLRRLLQPVGGERRFGLIGFYRRGQESQLKEGLRFPYPFAGWSLASQGTGFWWEDALQTVLVSVGELAATADGEGLLHHFGLSADSTLPAVAWVRRDDALSFERAAPATFDGFLSWVYTKLVASVRIVNRDHRAATVWWLDGHTAKKQGTIAPGGTFEHSSYVSHRWYCWAEETEGNLLSAGAMLGEVTLARAGGAPARRPARSHRAALAVRLTPAVPVRAESQRCTSWCSSRSASTRTGTALSGSSSASASGTQRT